MFKPVDSKVNFPKMEESVLQFWKENDIFRKSTAERADRPLYVLYEGPPTANNNPGIHHVLSRVFKDVIPRYKTMKGHYVPRKGGWDTHGLPVELEIERALGLSSKPEIERYGVERFNQQCRDSVMRYVKEWESLTDRIAFWLDMEDPYITFKNEYVESCWWIMRQLWDAGLVYRGYKTTPHCPRCGTSLSSHEVALGYKDDTVDPSVYIKFRLDPEASGFDRPVLSGAEGLTTGAAAGGTAPELLKSDTPTYFLAWTTTPWTLPGNTALAVSAEAEYAVVETEGKGGQPERLVLASALVSRALRGEYSALGHIKGGDLVGLRYEPLYSPAEVPVSVMEFVEQGGGTARLQVAPRRERWSYPVIGGDFVSMEDGAGIVHIAPAFGEVDFQAGQEEGLYFVQPVDLAGNMSLSFPWVSSPADDVKGRFVKDADPRVIADLDRRGLLYRSETITHTYPFCWRCDSPLLYYVKTSWYIQTTAVKEKLISGNQEINWRPEHVKNGRFGDWLENNVDWAVSRERYWGTPLPVWRCESCEGYTCIGSVADLAGQRDLEGYQEGMDLHRPYIDRVTFTCRDCGGRMSREPEVLDAWFDSGAMPVAQWHYPFENRDKIESDDQGRSYFPADYICEAVDQTRGWFYTLHALSTLLNHCRPDVFTSSICYRNVICLGHILDARGEKMSKSRGNVVEPWPVINANGADALRWYLYTASLAGNPRRFSTDLVAESLRKFLLTLWNTYSFFVIYANIDNYNPRESKAAQPDSIEPALSLSKGSPQVSELDRWITSELNRLVRDVTADLEEYNPTDAGRRIQGFVDNLSNWYVRRSRRRFWKSGVLSGPKGENDDDKRAAYDTLYNCLVTLSKLLAPFTPFVAEEMYQNLVRSVDGSAPESVHLAEYPSAEESRIDEKLSEDTALVMRIVSLGRAARSKAGVKVRQPLQNVRIKVRNRFEEQGIRTLEGQIKDELNVRDVVVDSDEYADIDIWDWRITANRARVGPKYGNKLREIEVALSALTSEESRRFAKDLRVGLLEVPLPSINISLDRDEVSAEPVEPTRYAVIEEAGYIVAVSTDITPELAEEGLARELVHRLQTMRRSANFDIADHIVTYYLGDEEIKEVVAKWGDYIKQETLSTELVESEPAPEASRETLRVDGHAVTLGVQRKA